MSDDETTPAAPVEYKGHQIILMPSQQADETWICRFLIIDFGQPPIDSNKGYPDGSFPSREAAELAALQKAKALIDLRAPNGAG